MAPCSEGDGSLHGWGRWYRTKPRARSFLRTGGRARESGGGADGLQNCTEEPETLLRCRLWRAQEERERRDLKHRSFYLPCCSLSARRSNSLSTWEPLRPQKGSKALGNLHQMMEEMEIDPTEESWTTGREGVSERGVYAICWLCKIDCV